MLRSLRSQKGGGIVAAVLSCAVALGCTDSARPNDTPPSDERLELQDRLSALWSYYKYTYVQNGRVVAHDENGITTSEGQSYAMLRAVWSNDRDTFDVVWGWTQTHLQVRDDHLFAWKWNKKVLDQNSATDADVDIALALALAAKRFEHVSYLESARKVLKDIWKHEVVAVEGKPYLVAGNWAAAKQRAPIHVAYLAPYAYSLFATIDSEHDWAGLVQTSYEILHWLYDEQQVVFPPEVITVHTKTGRLSIAKRQGHEAGYGYDTVPLPWRLAVDAAWWDRPEGELREKVLAAFRNEWGKRKQILDQYSVKGTPRSKVEGLPHYAGIYALATIDDPDLAQELFDQKLEKLWSKALKGKDTPYYLHNWLWFSLALDLGEVRAFATFEGMFQGFDREQLVAQIPWVLLILVLLCYFGASRWNAARYAFFAGSFVLVIQYFVWRATHSLNFIETFGPLISIMLLLAEAYSVSTVVLLMFQLGLRIPKPREQKIGQTDLSVDIYVPIYSEPLPILEKTLIAANAIDYPNKTVYVLDDSHQDEVRDLARRCGAKYIRGPRKHAKAGNLNNALEKTSGDLLVVFDTDHIPNQSFLRETAYHFEDERVAIVQTPHHFYNEDIFQRAFLAAGDIPNEQDMFNHSMQAARDSWGGSFFVGSGAVFRRRALVENGGFNLLSITEDIHTSQCLHARGWKSVFVDKDLAVGLTAEDYPSYLIQRTRWMQGCLQVFFRDNPLFKKGLPWRHRVGYFASLYYFFYPLVRIVYWATPLFFLFFHWHPLFADLTTLLTYLIPYMIVVPLMGKVLLPSWPRMGWGVLYEVAVTFPLARSMLSMLFPKSLGFKVTPKGMVSANRSFDWSASWATVLATAVVFVALAKGTWEFWYFGIERDAYVINLAWAAYNFLFLAAALLVAWERPQQRADARVDIDLFVQVNGEDLGTTRDASLGGFSIVLPRRYDFEDVTQFQLSSYAKAWNVRARLVYNEPVGFGRHRAGFSFEEPPDDDSFFLHLFCAADRWLDVHARRTRSNWRMLARLVACIPRAFRPLQQRRRRWPRPFSLRRARYVSPGGVVSVWIQNRHQRGMALVGLNRPFALGEVITLLGFGEGVRSARVVYCRKSWLGRWRIGVTFDSKPDAQPHAVDEYLAAA